MNTARELVDCNIRVSPTLARRLRKAALAENEGQDARAALMTAAGCDPQELDRLRTLVAHLESSLESDQQKLTSLNAAVDRLNTELSQVRKQLGKKDEAISSARADLEAANGRVVQLDNSLELIRKAHATNQEKAEKLATSLRSILSSDSAPATPEVDQTAIDEALVLVGQLHKAIEGMNHRMAPLEAVLEAGGASAWIIRRILASKS